MTETINQCPIIWQEILLAIFLVITIAVAIYGVVYVMAYIAVVKGRTKFYNFQLEQAKGNRFKLTFMITGDDPWVIMLVLGFAITAIIVPTAVIVTRLDNAIELHSKSNCPKCVWQWKTLPDKPRFHYIDGKAVEIKPETVREWLDCDYYRRRTNTLD